MKRTGRTCYTQGMFARAFSAALLLAFPAAAAAADTLPPAISNFTMRGCNGDFVETVGPSTGTAEAAISVRDAGVSGSTSGLRIGRQEHLGGAGALSGTVLFLKFNEWPAIVDSTTYNHTVTPSASITQSAGQTGFGSAAHWPGTAEHLEIPKSANLNSTTQHLTLQAWINPADTNERPLFEWNNTGTRGVYFWQGPSGGLYANLVSSSGYNQNWVRSSPGVITAGKWQLVTLAYDAQVARIFVNDVFVASSTLCSTCTVGLQTSFNLYVGRNGLAGGSTFSGDMDEVRVINHALRDITVINDYHAGQFQYSLISETGPYITSYLASSSYTLAAANGSTALHFTTSTATAFYPNASNHLRYSFQDMAGNTVYEYRRVRPVTGPPAAPSVLTGAAQTSTRIDWNWAASQGLCTGGTYRFYSCESAVPLATGLVSLSRTDDPLGVNSLNCRRVSALTTYGESALTAPTSVYTFANPSTAFSPTSASTSSLTLAWTPNNNPSYTRWEVTLSTTGAFTVEFTTPAAVEENLTEASKLLSGLDPSVTYYVRVRAFNGSGTDFGTLGGTPTTAISTAVNSLSTPPTFTGDPQGISSITWTWSAAPTALDYTLALRTSTGGALGSATTSGTSYSQTGLSANVRYAAQLSVRNASGLGPPGATSYAYTRTAVPGQVSILFISTDTLSVSWDPNGNPSGTFYRLFLSPTPPAADVAGSASSGFGANISTWSATSPSLTLNGLLPGTSYYLRIQSINGDAVASGFNASTFTRTTTFSAISSTTSPPSPYVPASAMIGLWHFDDAISTRAADSSGAENHGDIHCGAGCSSTPTFTAGRTGMGTALRFLGLANSFVRVGHNAGLAGTGSMSVEAWVKPDANPIDGAGIVVKGSGTNESFGLDISGGKWRFFVRSAGFAAAFPVSSTRTFTAGAWTHLAGVYDAAAPSLSLFVDGVLSSSTTAAPASRGNDTHELAIGSRQSASGVYDRYFSGLIDEVHLLSRVLAATEAASGFSSSAPTSVSSADASVRILLPPAAFSAQAVLLLSGDPVGSPIRIQPQIVRDGLANPPTGQTLLSGSVVEVVASVGGVAFEGTLGASASISIPYADSDDNTLVDGISPPIQASRLTVYTLNPSVVRWEPLPSSVDTQAKRVTGLTPHFSVFALFGPSASLPDVNSVRVYPNPWKPGSGGTFDSGSFNGKTGLVIDNLPSSGIVRIFTLSGESVAELSFSPPDVGTLVWDGRNRAGRGVASGVYFAYVKADGGGKAVVKFAIER